jgi:uncharacterized protein (TIGR02271 family)
MTMQADQLIGTSVIGSDGRALGAVTAVFHDDADGTPKWVRIQAGKSLPFVPLAGSSMTGRGLQVAFNSQKIVEEPRLNVDKHMSPAQEEELGRYFGIGALGQPGRTRSGPAEAGRAQAGDEDWIDLAEERLAVRTEVVESGRARLHKYVEAKPFEQTVQVSHEEYEIEHMPVTPGVTADRPMADAEQELILHEEHAVVSKETIPVDRVRLSAKTVTEDEVIRGEVRKERIEVGTDAAAPAPRTGNSPDNAGRRR